MTEPLRLALYQPDIPQNTGALLRLSACLRVPVDIIEPCGFVLDDKKLRRAGMDYLSHASFARYPSWQVFHRAAKSAGRRLVLLTTKGAEDLPAFAFRPGDTLLLGRESAGVPDSVAEAVDARLRIPMAPEARSLNLALAAAMAVGCALDRLGAWPG